MVNYHDVSCQKLHFIAVLSFGMDPQPCQGAVIAQSVQRLGYGLDDRGSGVRFPAGAGNFSLHHRVQNGSGAHPASYPVGTRCSFAGGKAAGA
jgi:hypothetical protein